MNNGQSGGATAEQIEELVDQVSRWLRSQVGRRSVAIGIEAGVCPVKPAPGDQYQRFERTTGGRCTITVDDAEGCEPLDRTPPSVMHAIRLLSDLKDANDALQPYLEAVRDCAESVKRLTQELPRTPSPLKTDQFAEVAKLACVALADLDPRGKLARPKATGGDCSHPKGRDDTKHVRASGRGRKAAQRKPRCGRNTSR